MAESTTAPNNKPVTFGAKVVREPAGVTDAAPMKPRAPSGAAKKAVVRKKAKGAIKRGMISEKAAKRHLGDY